MVKTRSLSRGVAIVGAGMSKFGIFQEKTSRDLLVEAYQAMSAEVDRDFDPAEIDSIYMGNFSSDVFEGQGHIAPIMADTLGLAPRPATRIEDACASGGAAMRQGIMAIGSGLEDVVLVGGVEHMSHLTTSQVTDTLAMAGDMLVEMAAGFTFPGVFAAMATAYMHRYGMKPEHLMNVALKNHANGALNPKAQFNLSIAEWMTVKAKLPGRRGNRFLIGRMNWIFCKMKPPTRSSPGPCASSIAPRSRMGLLACYWWQPSAPASLRTNRFISSVRVKPQFRLGGTRRFNQTAGCPNCRPGRL